MKVGFLFGAGAEIDYGMPSGGKFALDIFRQDPKDAKEKFKCIRKKIDKSTSYSSRWLPEDFDKSSIHVFGERVYDTIIKDTIGNNRKKIVSRINSFDEIAGDVVTIIDREMKINLEEKIKKDLGKNITEINIKQLIKYSKYFTNGNDLFSNNYFATLIEYYKSFENFKELERKELGNIIKAIFQLQIGAMSEELSRSLEDNIFSKNDLELDIFDDLGGSLGVNYETAGVKGLELLAVERDKIKKHYIIEFAYQIIEKIYADVLDYKSLIDTNWHYLYNPKNEWAKFCKISIFLYTVQSYILEEANSLNSKKIGYYDDLKESKLDISIIATTNYNTFIEKKLGREVVFLNGGVEDYYDPYTNAIGDKSSLNSKEVHFLVPLLFTQSGTKPMTSIDMAKKYVNFYEALKGSDYICSIGFGFNCDDEHINGIMRTLIDRDDKNLYIIDVDFSKNDTEKRKNYANKLKVKNSSNIKFITVNQVDRQYGGKSWVELLQDNK